MKHILLIEDDDWLAQMYTDALIELPSFKVYWARSADQALAQLDEKKIDLILLDMFLPKHNGIEFLHEIASYTDTKDTPVIILSAVHEHDFAMSPQQWQHYGVVQYLYKPTTKPQKLVSEVQKQLLANKVLKK